MTSSDRLARFLQQPTRVSASPGGVRHPGAMVVVRCPHDLDLLMPVAERLWARRSAMVDAALAIPVTQRLFRAVARSKTAVPVSAV